MPSRDRYYVTTPIYYVNDSPHIGHAYTTLACDVLARFMRLDGRKVKFLTGTDEHGQKIEKSARAAGMEPQAFTDKVSQNFRDLARAMNFSNDDFIRTTEERHVRSCQELWRRLKANGQIYLGSYSGWYAIADEAFYDEGDLTNGPGGKKIAPTGAECEWVEEPSYFFKLSEWQDRLLAYYDRTPSPVAPETRRNEVVSFVKGGLNDLSISRTTFTWGIPVPDDPAHIMYVWLDALTNYITAAGFPDTTSGDYKTFWPADLHMVGKDILRFHTVYWPAFLMAAGLEPPRRVFAHGWWTNEGQKISKRLGNVIDPLELIAKYGLDQVRYFLLREVPFGNDGDFSHRAIVERVTADLSNGLGNLAQRVLKMINASCEAAVPPPGQLTAADEALLAAARGLHARLREEMEQQAFYKALDILWLVIRDGDRYVNEQKPWSLKNTDRPRMNTVLYVLAETVRHLAILIQPFMPQTCGRLLDYLGIPGDGRNFAALSSRQLVPGTALPPPEALFPKYVEPAGVPATS
ncbi:MAG TPA: methionine--tRNA ligase [Candidatus Acidoferrum sp.]|nr:methionine--tRNA ligase [Candidatus Acidoferrum sp.]